MFYRTLVVFLALYSMPSYAISLNSLFELADKNGGATYTVTNTTEDRIFLNIVMYKFYLEDGELKKTAYTRENIQDWEISVRPARTIINPGFQKDFRVTLNCGKNCDNLSDQAYQIGFVPTPYFAEGERPEQAMQIAVGFGANFVNTGKEEDLNYELSRSEDLIHITNNSRSLNTATLSTCSVNATHDEKKQCEKTVNIISKRKLPVSLTAEMQGKPVTITLKSVDKNYQKIEVLQP